MTQDTATVINKYKSNISSTSYEKGVNAVTVNPAAKAVAQKDLYIKNVLAGKADMIKNLQKVTLSDWQGAMNNSLPKLQEKAIRAAETGKYPASTVLDAGKAAHQVVQNMPKGNLQNSLARYKAAQAAIKQKYSK